MPKQRVSRVVQEKEILACGKRAVSRRARALSLGREQVAALAELRAQSQVRSGGITF